MKFKFLLIVLLAFSVSACGFRKKDRDTVDDLAADIEAINTALPSTPTVPLISEPLPPLSTSALTSGRTVPQTQDPFTSSPGNFAPLPAPVVSAPITPAPQISVGTQEALRAEAGDRVFFQTGTAELDTRAQAILSSVAAWMRQNPQRNLSIEGHADERGTREYNLALGERRASAVKNYLASQGVSSARLNSLSFGKERPASSGSNPQAWALNRRSVFIVR